MILKPFNFLEKDMNGNLSLSIYLFGGDTLDLEESAADLTETLKIRLFIILKSFPFKVECMRLM